jgi:mRNA-degrading endonuclease RelE of RelBE toxin-antitoxin system
MSRYTVLLSQTAVKQLKALPESEAELVKEKSCLLEDSLFDPRPGLDIKRLRASHDPPFFRLRVGDCRAIFTVINREVRVTEILRRSKAYRWLD